MLADPLDPVVLEDPYPFYASLRREAPVYEIPGTGLWLVATWELVLEALERTEEFSSNLTAVLVTGPGGRPKLFDMGDAAALGVLATADPPQHTPQRKLVQPVLALGRVARLEAEIRRLASELLAPGLDTGRLEWMDGLANPLPMRIVAEVLGFPQADAERLVRWSFDGTELLSGVAGLERMAFLQGQTAALQAYLAERFREVAGERERDPEADVVGAVVHAIGRGEITEAEGIGMLVILVGAGGESTTSLTGSAARLLAERSDLQARLRAHPEQIPAFVEEALRLESPFRGHYRGVRRDAELGGARIPARSSLLLLWSSANRDEKEFERPDALDLDRRVARNHLAFGRGIHFCVGAPLARLEARVVLETLLSRTRRFRLDPERPPRHVPSLFVRRLEHLDLLLEAA